MFTSSVCMPAPSALESDNPGKPCQRLRCPDLSKGMCKSGGRRREPLNFLIPGQGNPNSLVHVCLRQHRCIEAKIFNNVENRCALQTFNSTFFHVFLPLPAMPPLRSIVYTSAAVRPLNSGDLDALLVDARNFNGHNAITGVLLHSGSNFMQCFEGPEEAVQRVYQRILGSRTHTDVVEFMNLPVQQRTFSGWAMGSAMTTPSELLALSTAQWSQFNSELTFSPFTPPGLAILQVFWSMRQKACAHS